MYKKIVLTYLLIFYAAIGAAGAEEKTINIGVTAVYSGGFAAIGKVVADGQIDYLKWTDDKGGIEYKEPVSGKTEKVRIRVISEDNQYNAAKAVSVYNNFKAQGVNAVIGFGSTPGEACSAFASQDKIPYFSWYSYASPTGYKAKPQYYWSFLPTIAESVTPMIKWLIAKKLQEGAKTPKVGIMAANVPSWQVLGKPGLMGGYIKSIGGESVGIEFIPLVATDLSKHLVKLIFENKADGIVLAGTLSQTVVMAKDLKRLGIDPVKTSVICNVSAWDESLFQSIPAEIEGLYGEVHVVSVDADIPGMKMVKEIASRSGRNPEALMINYTNGMVGSMVLVKAIQRALEKVGYEKMMQSDEAIRDELHNFKAFDPFGLAPTIEVKYPDLPYFLNYARIIQAKGGKFTDAGEWISVDRIPGTLE